MSHDAVPPKDYFRDYIKSIEKNVLINSRKTKKLSQVKQLILETLWKAGNCFPRDWVSSGELLKVTQQKYFDRRIRELRNEMGCDIETGIYQGESSYRLLSINLNKAFGRSYLTALQKRKLFEQYDYQCAACGQQFTPGQTGLEADHKVPLIRGGGSEFENWQPLCTGCNVAKRRSCQGCRVDCQTCAWAFPERYSRMIPVQLSRDLAKQVDEISKQKSQPPQTLISEAINEWVARQLDH